MQREFSPSELREPDYEPEDGDLEALRKHRTTCPHEDCLCRNPDTNPGRGDLVKAEESTGIVMGKARDGMITVKWGEFWMQGYDLDRFIVVGDHWELGDA